MIYSTTGIAYLSLFIVLSYLLYRFLGYFKKDRTTVSKFFFLLILPFWILAVIRTIGGLFFLNNSDFLKLTVDAAAFLEAIGLAMGGYLFVHIKFPKISPWFGFSPILILGLIAAFFTINSPFQPFLESSGAINWDLSSISFYVLLLRAFIFIVVFIFLILLYTQALKSPDSVLKKIAQKVILFFFFGILIIILNFIILTIFHLDAIWGDIGLVVLSLVLFLSLTTKKLLAFQKK